MDLLECPLCLFLMCEPVTMSCGHTFCRRCVGGQILPSKCPACKVRLKQKEVKGMKNNVLLISVVEKCCPDETRMKCHVQEKLKANEFVEALRIANEGLDLGKAHMYDTTTAAGTVGYSRLSICVFITYDHNAIKQRRQTSLKSYFCALQSWLITQ